MNTVGVESRGTGRVRCRRLVRYAEGFGICSVGVGQGALGDLKSRQDSIRLACQKKRRVREEGQLRAWMDNGGELTQASTKTGTGKRGSMTKSQENW